MSAEIEQSTRNDVVFDLDDGGLYLRGDRARIDAVLDQLLSPAEVRSRRGKVASHADVAAGAATASAVLAANEEYLRLTPASLAKLQALGEQVDDAGSLRGYLRDGNKFAGDLRFDKVSFAPEQALALQTAAVSLALRSAIADVKKAVEEVQDSVDELARRARSQEVGRIVGIYEHLDAIVTSTASRGTLLRADWDSASGAGLELRQSLAALRAFAQTTMDSFDEDARLVKRAKAVAAFGDAQHLGGALKLIAVAEKALHLWEYLRIEHVRAHDPEHVESALADARASLRTHRERDRALVLQCTSKLEELRTIGPLETHHLLTIPDLRRSADSALDALLEFASMSRTEVPLLDRSIHRPKLAETGAEVKRQAIGAKDGAVQVSRTAGKATARSANKAAKKATKPLRDLRK